MTRCPEIPACSFTSSHFNDFINFVLLSISSPFVNLSTSSFHLRHVPQLFSYHIT
jgi:hypothetical protein